MPILQAATVQDRKRLLELFPIAVFRESYPDLKGTKEEICYALAERLTPDQMGTFVRNHLSRCKQHAYIYDRQGNDPVILRDVAGAEKVFNSEVEALYIIKTVFSIILGDPPEDSELDFLWPVLVQVKERNIVVRFVALEKDVASYFERRCWVAGRTVDERDVLKDLQLAASTDIHKGIKQLWDEGFMDSPRARYKKPESTAWEAMDEERGIREHNPELYETLLDSVLLNTLFVIKEDQKCGTSAFLAYCQNGFLAFPRYSEAERNTDFVINEILQRNR
jgi:hypothetical protein